MSTMIRLQRHGKTHRPFYHLVVADKRKPRNGRFIERLGYYDPNAEPSIVKFKDDRIQHWYALGAGLSPTVATLLKKLKVPLERAKVHKSA